MLEMLEYENKLLFCFKTSLVSLSNYDTVLQIN